MIRVNLTDYLVIVLVDHEKVAVNWVRIFVKEIYCLYTPHKGLL